MAPFTSFLAEELYHNLTGDSESVHLKDWLPAGKTMPLVEKRYGRRKLLLSRVYLQGLVTE